MVYHSLRRIPKGQFMLRHLAVGRHRRLVLALPDPLLLLLLLQIAQELVLLRLSLNEFLSRGREGGSKREGRGPP